MSNKRTAATSPASRRPAQPGRRQQRRFPVLPAAFVALAVLLVIAIAFSGGGSTTDADRIEQAAGAPLVEGTGLAAYRDAGPDPAVGTVAPTVIGSDYEGRTVTIEPDGRPKAIVFLAHWCPHCQAEVPEVQQWLDQTGGVEGVDIVSVSTAYQPERGNWSPGEWLEDEGWTQPLIRDDASSSVYTAYGAGPFPYWVFLAGDGKVAGRAAGRQNTASLEATFVSLLDA